MIWTSTGITDVTRICQEDGCDTVLVKIRPDSRAWPRYCPECRARRRKAVKERSDKKHFRKVKRRKERYYAQKMLKKNPNWVHSKDRCKGFNRCEDCGKVLPRKVSQGGHFKGPVARRCTACNKKAKNKRDQLRRAADPEYLEKRRKSAREHARRKMAQLKKDPVAYRAFLDKRKSDRHKVEMRRRKKALIEYYQKSKTG